MQQWFPVEYWQVLQQLHRLPQLRLLQRLRHSRESSFKEEKVPSRIFLVLPKLTVSLPSHHINVSRWQIPSNLPMADLQFNISQMIDIIIGAELFFSLLEHQQIPLDAGCPLLQKTVPIGYIVCGKISDSALDPPAVQTSHICTDDLLDKQLERFWEIDNFDVGRSYTPDEQLYEDHFQQTVGRDTDERYIVRLPLREYMLPMLGDSYQLVFRRFQSMEKKFAGDEGLRIAYHEFPAGV
nr:uncharacterized protein LOC115263673 [Aedes albopictus]